MKNSQKTLIDVDETPTKQTTQVNLDDAEKILNSINSAENDQVINVTSPKVVRGVQFEVANGDDDEDEHERQLTGNTSKQEFIKPDIENMGPDEFNEQARTTPDIAKKFRETLDETQDGIVNITKLFNNNDNEEVNKFEQRNIEIQKYSAEQYSHIYLVKNLRLLEADENDQEVQHLELISNPPWKIGEFKIEDRKRFHRRNRVDSHYFNGMLYSIVRVYLRCKTKNSLDVDPKDLLKQHQSMSLVILKHDPKYEEPQRILEEQLQFNDQEHDWCMNLRPYFLYQNILYFATYKNDFKEKKIHFDICQFEFETEKMSIKYQRDENMGESEHYKNQPIYATQIMLSNYLKQDDDEEKDVNDGGSDDGAAVQEQQTVNETQKEMEQQDLELNTYVYVSYRCVSSKYIDISYMGSQKIIKAHLVKTKKNIVQAQSDSDEEHNQGDEQERDMDMDLDYCTDFNVYCMFEFNSEQHPLNLTQRQEKGDKTLKQETVISCFQFVKNNIYMLCQNINGKLKLQYFIVDEINDGDDDGGSSSHSAAAKQRVQFSSLQDANEVDKETITYIKETYIPQFALYNVCDDKLTETKIWEQKKKDTSKKKKKYKKKLLEDDTIITQYNKVCNHFGFNFGYDSVNKKWKKPNSVNFVFNIQESPPKVYIIAARFNDIMVRRITLTNDFTRMGRKSVDQKDKKESNIITNRFLTTDKGKISMFGRTITSHSIELKIGGSQKDGIFVQIKSRKTDEILLKEQIQAYYSQEVIFSATMCWSSEILWDKQDKYKYKNFQVAIFDDIKQVCQILEYKLSYNSANIQRRLVEKNQPNKTMSSFDFIRFLYKSKDTVSIDLVGMNLIVLKAPYKSKKIVLNPELNDENQIQGTLWRESKHRESGFEVRIKERKSNKFTIRSDICKSLYKYYYREDDPFPSIIHVQSCLSGIMESLYKSSYQDALSVIKTIRETNVNLSDKLYNGSCFALDSRRFVALFKDLYDGQGLNQQDRYVILKTNIRVVLNMVPIDFENFKVDFKNVDCLQPMEILNCQTECDFSLRYPMAIINALENEAANHKNLLPGIIQKFIYQKDGESNKDLKQSLYGLGFLRKHNEIMYGLYFSNSLIRCFQQAKPRIETAQILINNMMKKKFLTIYERDVICGSLPDILNCKRKPYPFTEITKFFTKHKYDRNKAQRQQPLSFYQSIKDKDSIRYNQWKQEVTPIDQRNCSANKNLFFIDKLVKTQMEFNIQTIDPEHLKYQVQHCCIDLHAVNLVEKIKWIQKDKVVTKYKPYTIQDIMVLINNNFQEDIENHVVLQKIIDAQFYKYAQPYYSMIFILYFFLFCAPFIYQLSSHDENVIYWCNISCMCVTILFCLFLWLDYYYGRYKNFLEVLSFTTCINIIQYIAYSCYFVWRIQNTQVSALPDIDDHFPDKQRDMKHEVLISFINVIIIFGMILKLMDIIIFMDTFQNIVMLVLEVVKDVFAYFIFLILWVFIFAFFYQSLGINVGSSADSKDNTITNYLTGSWEISILGKSTEVNSNFASAYWQTDDKNLQFVSDFQIVLINLITIVNQVYLKIIMFGFLIAMIKNTFDKNQRMRVCNKYIYRSEMNQVSYNIYRLIPFVPVFETDLIVVSAYFDEPIEIINDEEQLWKKKVETDIKEIKHMVQQLLDKDKKIEQPEEEHIKGNNNS